jgi:hypothetical protein
VAHKEFLWKRMHVLSRNDMTWQKGEQQIVLHLAMRGIMTEGVLERYNYSKVTNEKF